LSLISDLIVDDTDGFVRNRRNEATREPFDKDQPHSVELVESSKDIDLAILVFSFNQIHHMLTESTPECLVVSDMECNAFAKFILLLKY
jgi:hypothetical protein